MTNHPSDWVFNLILRFSAVVCLSIMALGLVLGVGPLTALLRSAVAFIAFAGLGWAVALVWDAPRAETLADTPEPTRTGGGAGEAPYGSAGDALPTETDRTSDANIKSQLSNDKQT